MKVKVYQNSENAAWDKFITESKNGNFHLQRGFVEYHKDRFTDMSLMIYDESEILLALLPGNKKDNAYYSHQGLTYGGFIVKADLRIEVFAEVFSSTVQFLKESGFSKFYYKVIPHIYHKSPAEEDQYLLYLVNAQLVSRHVNPVITLHNRIEFQERRARAIKKAEKNNIEIKESSDIKSYWDMITGLLAAYNSKPVHTYSEIEQLRGLFNENLKLIAAFKEDKMLAGILIFESEMVAKMQYIGANEEGKKAGALDLVFNYLINTLYVSKPFIDFGTSTTDGGNHLSIGISNQKEGFGARTTTADQYLVDLSTLDVSKITNLVE